MTSSLGRLRPRLFIAICLLQVKFAQFHFHHTDCVTITCVSAVVMNTLLLDPAGKWVTWDEKKPHINK